MVVHLTPNQKVLGSSPNGSIPTSISHKFNSKRRIAIKNKHTLILFLLVINDISSSDNMIF